MKLKTLTMLAVVGMTSAAFGQGVILDNLNNSGAVGALSGGLIYVNNGTTTTVFDGNTFNLGVVVSGGINAGSLSPMGSFTAATDAKGYTGADVGKFQLGAPFAAVNVPGVAAGGIATIHLDIWYDGPGGLFANFGAASVGGGFVGSSTFQNSTSNPGASPPVPPSNLTGMPSITLAAVPEPSTMVLAGLGAASLLIFRRRK